MKLKIKQCFCKHDYKLISGHKEEYKGICICKKCGIYSFHNFKYNTVELSNDLSSFEDAKDFENWITITN